MDRLSNPAKIRAYALAEQLKNFILHCFKNIWTTSWAEPSNGMMEDWGNDDANLLKWRAATAETAFEKNRTYPRSYSRTGLFWSWHLDDCLREGWVELAFETMVSSGIIQNLLITNRCTSCHWLPIPLPAKKLYEMNGLFQIRQSMVVICLIILRNHCFKILWRAFCQRISGNRPLNRSVDNVMLIKANEAIAAHPIEHIGKVLRGASDWNENH